ncbi:MAG: hypothetical protein ACYS0E_14870 [Planctomycetota bacterium]|jgi:hypothetical protein
MQNELAGTDIRIIGINQATASAGNIDTCDGKDIPWLQPDGFIDPWTDWNVRYRDVIILDADNIPVAVYNLTDHNLQDAPSYAELKALLEAQ